jgi:hypothetical protein
VQHGVTWRAPCPIHGGDSTTALRISEGRDRYGNPCTLIHCFARGCAIEDLCDYMGIHLRNLFSIHPDYARATQHVPRSRSPRIERLKAMQDATGDDVAQVLLEELIVSDPSFIQECEPARAKLWALAQASPKAHEAFSRTLEQAKLSPLKFWHQLAHDMRGKADGPDPAAV